MSTLENMLTNVEFAQGQLLDVHSRIVPGSELHAHEIMTLRELKPEFRNLWTWTADFPIYSLNTSQEAVFSLATREHHLGFRHIGNYVNGLLSSETGHNYFIESREEINEVLNAQSTVTVKISELKLKKDDPNSEWGYFETKNMRTDAQRRVAERVYGKDKPVGDRIYVLTQDCVKEKLKGKEDGAIARASGLLRAYYGSRFVADGWDVGVADDGLLGVLKEAPKAPQKLAEGTEAQPPQNIMPYADALKLVEQQYAPRKSPLFPVFERMLGQIYRAKQ